MIIPVGCHSDFYLDTTQLSGTYHVFDVKVPKYPHGDFRGKVQFVTIARVYAE